MIFKTNEILQNIKELLLLLEREIEYDNSGQNFDANKYAEDFYSGLLNKIYPNWNLINLNTKQHNHPAIDLGCDKNKIGIQITSENSKDKVDKTLATFYRHNLEKDYIKLYFIMIKGKSDVQNKKIVNNGSLSFNKYTDIIDNTEIIKWIRTQNCNTTQLSDIERYIKNQLRIKNNLYERVLLPIMSKLNEVNNFGFDKMTFIHFSDIEYDNSLFINSPECYDYLFTELEKFQNTINYVIISGNHLSKSTEKNHYKYIEYRDNFIGKIASSLKIELSQIIISQGDLDFNQALLKPWFENSIKDSLKSQNDIQSFIEDNRKSNTAVHKVIDYKKFENIFFEKVLFKQQTIFDTSIIQNFNGEDIGFSLINPTLLCNSSVALQKNQLIGKEQILNSLTFLDDCKFKILVNYFPFDWLQKFEQKEIDDLWHKFNIVFLGKITDTKYQTGFHKNTFIELFDIPIDNKIGFKKIDFDISLQKVNISKITFINTENKFSESVQEFDFPTEKDIIYQSKNIEIIKTIQTVELVDIDKQLIIHGSNTQASAKIQDLFVTPIITEKPIEDSDEKNIKSYDIEDLISIPESILIFGRKESGKTILLDKLLIEIANNYEKYKKIPVLVDFIEIKSIESEIRRFIATNKDICQERIDKSDIVLLIDGLAFDEEHKFALQSLNNFKKQYKNIKIIATSNRVSKSSLPWEYQEHIKDCYFKILFLRDFGSKQIKQLAKNWFRDSTLYNQEDDFEKLVKSFNAFSLPRTPMAVSLFFWIIETQERKPVNNSTLLERFIENILDKVKKDQIYTDTFDYKNKLFLLADITHFMYSQENENYSIEYGKLVAYTHDLLIEKGFNSKSNIVYDGQKIIDNFIKRGIFNRSNGYVKYRFECFFHFFLAQKIRFDKEFRDFVIKEENYLSFIDEIDYYTGLVRDDEEYLQIVFDRLKNSFSEYRQRITPKQIDFLFHENQSIAAQVDFEAVIESRPTEQQIEQMHDEILTNTPIKTEIRHKEKSINRLDLLIMLAGKILKNSEEVKNNNLKKDTYNEVIKDSIIHMSLYKVWLLKYYAENKKMPDNIPWRIDINAFIRILPLLYQLSTYDNIGSKKVATIIHDKLVSDKIDKNISEIERFFSVFIYADIKEISYHNLLKNYIYTNVKSNAIIDLCFFKAVTYFYLRSKKGGTNEDFYLDLIAELKSKRFTNINKGAYKQRLIKYYKELKEKNVDLFD